MVYTPRSFIPHAALLRHAFAHCGIFVTAASRRSPGSVSVPMRRVMLSHPLPVFGLVSRYLTNYLIGRSPLPRRQSFPPKSTWSITADFSTLSSTLGYVRSHYSPFRHFCPEGLSFDLHALAMPPAFNLSQDQTLQLIAYASGDKHRSISRFETV